MMRALTINEDQHFERGLNPRASMNVGGINFGKILADGYKELWDKWWNNIVDSLVGKTITAKMTKANSYSMMRTVKVERLLEPVTTIGSDEEIHVSLYFIDTEGVVYYLGHLDSQKIFIEDES
jgi:hypothetical protein